MQTKLLILSLIFKVSIIPSIAQKISWASHVINVSSEFEKKGTKSKAYKAVQALGKPSVLSSFGESHCAWAPVGKKDKIKVGFDKPLRANKVIINQNYRAGVITKIILTDAASKEIVVFEQKKGKEMDKGQTLNITFELTPLPIHTVEILLDRTKSQGYNQIDAIGIAEMEQDYYPMINFLVDTQIEVEIQKLGRNINSEYAEISPCISPNGNILLFTRGGHPENKGNELKQDIWIATKNENGIFSKAKNIGAPINNESHNSVFSCNNQKRLLLNNQYYPDKMEKGVSVSRFDEEKNIWHYPENFAIENFKNYHAYSEFFISKNDSIMLMTIVSDEGQGNKDLHVSFKIGKNKYSTPLNLGKEINTASSETSPFLSADSRFLFFSTSGYVGFGSNDFFVSERLDDTWTHWSEPKNLGPWINTNTWDAYLSITEDMKHLYFSSYRDGNEQSDIYYTQLPDELISIFLKPTND